MTKPLKAARTETRVRPLALGYCRVSTAEQADSGAGMAAQRSALIAQADARGWDLEIIEEPAMSGGNADRPRLNEALARLRAGDADVLAVAKLDRMSRSVAHGASLLEQAISQGWAIVALDMGIDTSTPSGELMANTLLSFARFEKRLIGQRTKDGLAEKRAAGVKLGRKASIPAPVRARIQAERVAGATLQQIADGLTADGIPTARGGGAWYPGTVRAAVAYEGETAEAGAAAVAAKRAALAEGRRV